MLSYNNGSKCKKQDLTPYTMTIRPNHPVDESGGATRVLNPSELPLAREVVRHYCMKQLAPIVSVLSHVCASFEVLFNVTFVGRQKMIKPYESHNWHYITRFHDGRLSQKADVLSPPICVATLPVKEQLKTFTIARRPIF
jgi:hypothetical protein